MTKSLKLLNSQLGIILNHPFLTERDKSVLVNLIATSIPADITRPGEIIFLKGKHIKISKPEFLNANRFSGKMSFLLTINRILLEFGKWEPWSIRCYLVKPNPPRKYCRVFIPLLNNINAIFLDLEGVTAVAPIPRRLIWSLDKINNTFIKTNLLTALSIAKSENEKTFERIKNGELFDCPATMFLSLLDEIKTKNQNYLTSSSSNPKPMDANHYQYDSHHTP